MENTKMNDMLLSTLANPEAKPLDFIDNGVTPETTQLLDRKEYKKKDFIKEQFTDADGVFQDDIFNHSYEVALNNFNRISDIEALKNLDAAEYEFYDFSRPSVSKARSVDIKYTKDRNPYETMYDREHFGSYTESPLSLREIAQKGRIFDTATQTWSETSANDLSIFDKFFGDTLVYAQWDEDGTHIDPVTGYEVNHVEGDWKVDEFGKLYVETLGDREYYGKQIVNPTDILTTDGSIANKFDFLDSDGKTKSIPSIAAKTIFEVAPLLIPGFNTWYGGAKAALGLATVMPTFLKSLQGFLMGDEVQFGDDPITKAENWMAKYRMPSTSDAGSEGMWNIEQMADMVTGIFSQIYEQRAAASLSKYIVRPEKLLDSRTAQLQAKLTSKAQQVAYATGVDTSKAIQNAVQHLPELQKAYAQQSTLSKGLSLGYMALSSTSEVYGEALAGGFDRRSAGFGALLAAGGQYALMMNNRMGHWFLDKTTGYTEETNRALLNKSIRPWLKEIDKVFTDTTLSKEAQKRALGDIMQKVQRGTQNFFTGSSILGEAMLKNMAIEGVEEVTEEVVEDMSKGVLDLMSYFGLTKNKGSFQTLERFQTGEFFDDYLANFVGGVLGGGLFELEAAKISPWIRKHVQGKPMPKHTLYSIYDLIANGHKDELIQSIRKQAPQLTNQYLSYRQDIKADADSKINQEADYLPNDGASQADLVSKAAIEMVEHLEGILGSEGLILTDEQIINKAIGNELKIDSLNKLKEQGEYEHIGIEGLILQDFKKATNEVANLKATLQDYENAPEHTKNESKLNLEKEKLNQVKAEAEKILNGERNMEYFNMMTAALNPDIQKTFGSLDRDSYIRAKYKIDYKTLSDKGLEGLTKEQADQEWNEFIDSTDLLGKLRVITQGFVDLEQTLNKPIADTIESGYYDTRRISQNDFLNLDATIKSFNVNTDAHNRSRSLERFRRLNERLETHKDSTKILPWDAFKMDVGKKILDEGLIKKEIINEDGKSEYVEYTEQELDTVLGNKKTLRDTIIENINNVMQTLPTDPFDLELLTHEYNSVMDLNNMLLRNKIEQVKKSDASPADKAKEIKFYQDSISNNKIDIIENSISSKNFDRENLRKHQVKVEAIKRSHEQSIDKFLKAKEVAHKYVTQGDSDTKSDYITFESKVNVHGGQDGKWQEMSNVGKLNLLQDLTDSGIISEVIEGLDNVVNYQESYNEYLEALRDTGPEPKTIDSDFESGLFGRIEGNITDTVSILQDTTVEGKITEIQKLEESYRKRKMEAMPDIFKMPNYAFDFLVDTLLEGHYDNEMFLMAKDMYENELRSITKQIFPQSIHMPIEIINRMVEYSDSMAGDVLGVELSNRSEGDLGLLPVDTVETFLSELENVKEFIPQSESLDILESVLNHLDPNMTIFDAGVQFQNFSNNIESYKNSLQRLQKFTEIDSSKMIKNPIYEMLRNFNMTMDSNPDSKVNTIFEILAREETSFRASDGADRYTSNSIHSRDMQQAINIADMFQTVINSMSTTQRFGEDMNGFLAMRQDFARRMGITDPITDLKTISSDQAAVMSKDVQVLKTRLEFLKALSEDNQRNIADEHIKTGERANEAHADLFRDLDLLDIPGLTPDNFKDILNTEMPALEKVTLLETSFYDHHKNNKIGAMEKILTDALTFVSITDMTKYDTDITNKTMSDYTKALYLATVLSTRSEDYLKMQRDSLLSDYNKAPFYTQELAVRTSISHITNPEIFSKIFELKQDKTKDLADYLTFVLGGTGTGKTSVIGAQILDIMRQFNSNSNVWIGAPSSDQSNTLYTDIVDAVGDTNLNLTKVHTDQIFSLMGEGIKDIHNQINRELQDISNDNNQLITVEDPGRIKFKIDPEWANLINYENLPNLLIFDEVTHLSKPELMLLDFVSRSSYNNNSGNFFSVIGTGDISQLGKQVIFGSQHVNYNVSNLNSIYTPYLTSSVRNSNNQKKLNYDILSQATNRAIDIYSEEINIKNRNYKEADRKLNQYLTSVNTETSLSYYTDGSIFRGDYITDSYEDLSALRAIKKDFDVKAEEGTDLPDFAVLTETGELSPEIFKALQDSGFTDEFIDENIKIYTINNVQGSESDYFIFDVNSIPLYDKNRDLLRAFYTYTMRSKVGSVIYDTNNRIRDTLHITNAAMSDSTVDFYPLNENSIEKLKQDRLQEIDSVVDSGEVSEDSKYYWKSNKVISDQKSEKPEGPETKGKPSKQPSFSSITVPTSTPVFEATSEKEFEFVSKDNFKSEGHTFLHIPNAEVNTVRGMPTELKVHNSDVKMDLNGSSNLKGDPLTHVINDWANLKYHLIRNAADTVSFSDYTNYFTHIFGDRVINPKVEYMSIAYKHNSKIHTPMLTHMGSRGALQENDLVRSIAAKLTSGEGDNAKVHYVTLAMYPRVETLAQKGMRYLKADQSVKNELVSEYNNQNTELLKRIDAEGVEILETGKVDPSTIEIITSTRLVGGGKVEHSLDTLTRKFPGLKVSEIRIFPNNKKDFDNVVNMYSFGQHRTSEQLDTLRTGLKLNDNGEKVKIHEPFSGKPYVVVSYANDINGKSTMDSSARLLPITAKSRTAGTLRNEIIKTNKRLSDSFRNNNYIPDSLNAVQETLFDNNQILDILIEWGRTSTDDGYLIDNLTRKVDIGLGSENMKNVIDLMSRFRTTKGGVMTETQKAFTNVVEIVKKHTRDNFSDGSDGSQSSKELILRDISGITGWSWSFKNLFTYDYILRNSLKYVDELTNLTEKDTQNLTNLAETLEKSLNARNYFYSIPVQPGPDRGRVVVNDYISGKDGFSPEKVSDKFFINVNPQSERILFPIQHLIGETETTVERRRKRRGEGRGTGEGTTAKIDIVSHLKSNLEGFDSILQDIENSNWNPNLEQRIQEGYEKYINSPQYETRIKQLKNKGETMTDHELLAWSLANSGMDTDLTSVLYTADDLIDFILGKSYELETNEDIELMDKISEEVGALHERILGECPPGMFRVN